MVHNNTKSKLEEVKKCFVVWYPDTNPDSKRVPSNKEKIEIWNSSEIDEKFDAELFRKDYLENVCIRRSYLNKFGNKKIDYLNTIMIILLLILAVEKLKYEILEFSIQKLIDEKALTLTSRKLQMI